MLRAWYRTVDPIGPMFFSVTPTTGGDKVVFRVASAEAAVVLVVDRRRTTFAAFVSDFAETAGPFVDFLAERPIRRSVDPDFSCVLPMLYPTLSFWLNASRALKRLPS